MPETQRAYIDSWRVSNPGYTIQKWDESNIDMSQPIIQDAYARRKWAKVADIARLQAILGMGGIYLDTDVQVIRSLDVVRRYKCFYAFQQADPSDDWVGNCAFGAEPNHWFIRKALEGLYAMPIRPFLPERPTMFGPKHITRLLREAGLHYYSTNGVMVDDIFVAPVPTFFPFHYTGKFTPECVTPETLAIHFWEKSWQKSVPLLFRTMQQVREQLHRKRAS
jgi:hypothetical protein